MQVGGTFEQERLPEEAELLGIRLGGKEAEAEAAAWKVWEQPGPGGGTEW